MGQPQRAVSPWVWFFLLLACAAYVFGIDSVDIPSNGDEHVYLHIARRTFESGHWLPLQSDLEHTKNTKPPFLFWQAMVAGSADWSLGAIRRVSVAYTLLTALTVFGVIWRTTAAPRVAALGALTFLACYSVYRYGRPLLTDAPEFFWLSLVVLPVALRPAASTAPGLRYWTVLGVGLGIACLYKSFVLVVPVVAWWSLAVAFRRAEGQWPVRVGALWAGAVALGLFSLWFLLDPDPQAVFHEFVLGENVGKLGGLSGYVRGLLWGGSSIPGLFGALLLDGGVLAPVLFGLIALGWRQRRHLTDVERALWLWIVVLFVFFCLPAQRSGRYLLPALPALAVLGALRWESVARFWTSAACVLVGLVATIFLSVTAVVSSQPGSPLQPGALFYVACLGAVVAGVLGIVVRRWRPLGPAAGSVLLMASMGLFLRSYDHPPGPFPVSVRARVAGRPVAVPCDFVASEEAYRFLLPGADLRSYDLNWGLSTTDLSRDHHYFVARGPYPDGAFCEGCRVLGRRILVHGRLTGSDWMDVAHGNVLRHLLVTDTLLEGPSTERATGRPAEACTAEGAQAHANELRDER